MSEAQGDLSTESAFIVKADEVDQTGTALPTDVSGESASLQAFQASNDGSISFAIRSVPPKGPTPVRPGLRREGSAPPPPLQPPPPAPQLHNLDPENPTDSLSLPQLKQLVSQFPKLEQTAYAFKYADAQSFPEEIEEWFQYVEQERIMILSTKATFEDRWNSFCKTEQLNERSDSEDDEFVWMEASTEIQKRFLSMILEETKHTDILIRIEAAEMIIYILTGVWGLTAGLTPRPDGAENVHDAEDKLYFSRVQLEWIQKGAYLLYECSGINALYAYFERLFLSGKSYEDDPQPPVDENDEGVQEYAQQREYTVLMSSWYLLLEVARKDMDENGTSDIRDAIIKLKPNFLVSLVRVISNLRWTEQSNIPLTRLLLLFWKALLVIFGGSQALERAKEILQPERESFSSDATHPILTASPLDYHFFRQEITSKYPAYNPPPPLVPLELEHKSMLPPLPNHPSRNQTTAGPFSGLGPAEANSNSIFHQPVHIATPAPSPPPSPIGPGGKAGKKQNYQTNQNFPLLYPPLDDTSNMIGGKGSSNLQDSLVSKKWEGSDVPASIIEAGQLFAGRMRMTRAMRQLWRERELSMEEDRGWLSKGDTSDLAEDEGKVEGEDESANRKGKEEGAECDDPEVKARLDMVEEFYHLSLPELQSLVIVLLKTTLVNVQALAIQNGPSNSAGPDGVQRNGLPRSKSNMSLSQNNGGVGFEASIPLEELDNTRLRDISHKAISGALVVLLKWFKISHVLKFEYLTQLLLDSSCLPLILKFFAHQNMEDIVAQKNDREDLNFFHFCYLNSDHPPLSPTSPLAEDEPASPDDAAPPPILRHRRSPTSNSEGYHPLSTARADNASEEASNTQGRPAVDELGNPLAPLPSEPLEVYSWRNFFSSINFLRIMQKITRQKAHRCLLLVQYKSSNILRKVLKTPDPMLRLYTLKLFKSQVPYCGRKWRQSNMRVITAIYLHCRPELRDEWLAGMHDSQIEGEVDEALPFEQALRALTHWWHLRCYSDVIRGEDKEGDAMKEKEQDFFQRELNEMGWGSAGMSEEVVVGEEALGTDGHMGETYERFEAGGPLQMEGW